MHKIIKLSVPKYRMISVSFNDGRTGAFSVREKFTGVAAPLNDRDVFRTARIINDGHGIGFIGTDYDICAELVYSELSGRTVRRPRRARGTKTVLA